VRFVSEDRTGPVIAAVDGRERSADAVALARVLAGALGVPAAVANVYVTEPLTPGPLGEEVRALQREDAERVVAQAAGDGGEGGPLERHVTGASSAGRGLEQLAGDCGAACVVLGSSRRGALGRVLPGSASERLLNGAPCPVAVAPAGYAGAGGAKRPSTVAVAYDGTPEAARSLRWAGAVAARAGARVLLLHAVAPTAPREHRELYASFTEHIHGWARGELERGERMLPAGVAAETLVVEGEAAEALARAAEEAGADLLVTGSRGHGPVARVLLGGTSAALVRRAALPVVVVPRGAEEDVGGARDG